MDRDHVLSLASFKARKLSAAEQDAELLLALYSGCKARKPAGGYEKHLGNDRELLFHSYKSKTIAFAGRALLR